MMSLHSINDLRKLLLHIFKTRQLWSLDIVTACERPLLLYSCLSPLYGLMYSQRLERGFSLSIEKPPPAYSSSSSSSSS